MPARKTARKTTGAASRADDDPSGTQVQQAYDLMEEQIATLQLAPGQAVSENMLATRFGMGRTPVREALQQLSREGLVVIMPKRGVMVSQIDVRKQLRLLETRRWVERGLVAMATRRADTEQRIRFAELARLMDESAAENDGATFLTLDGEFNQLLVAAARNEYAAACMRLMQGLARRFWYANYRTAADLPETARLHAAIARGVADQDAPAAEQALDRLLDHVEAFTRATVDLDPMYLDRKPT